MHRNKKDDKGLGYLLFLQGGCWPRAPARCESLLRAPTCLCAPLLALFTALRGICELLCLCNDLSQRAGRRAGTDRTLVRIAQPVLSKQ